MLFSPACPPGSHAQLLRGATLRSPCAASRRSFAVIEPASSPGLQQLVYYNFLYSLIHAVFVAGLVIWKVRRAAQPGTAPLAAGSRSPAARKPPALLAPPLSDRRWMAST